MKPYDAMITRFDDGEDFNLLVLVASIFNMSFLGYRAARPVITSDGFVFSGSIMTHYSRKELYDCMMGVTALCDNPGILREWAARAVDDYTTPSFRFV